MSKRTFVVARSCSNRHCEPVFIASPDRVRGFSTRNPVHAWHWIPDRVRDDDQVLHAQLRRARADLRRVRFELRCPTLRKS